MSFIDLVAGIGACQAEEKYWKRQAPGLLAKLAQRSLVQSASASNRIEGIIASEMRMPAIVGNETKPIGDNELQIAGYADALRYIRDNYDSLPVNEDTIMRLHSMMYFRTSSAETWHYKTEDNVIAEVHADGSTYVRWVPVNHKDTPYAMQQLLLSYDFASNRADINQLVLIPCFILDFLCIHPFKDGNGRMSRLLTALLLYKIGYDVHTYISMEDWIYRERDWYYKALQQSSHGWKETKNDYIPFIYCFLHIMFMCSKDLTGYFDGIREGANKNERIRRTVLGSLMPISKKEICAALPDVSPTTVEAVLAAMQKERLIEKAGSTRGARYSRKQPGL
ncbi:MAG: Fic family protein [Clostridia bacterium]|nr:Fic family protein [Clostridia bacterium]